MRPFLSSLLALLLASCSTLVRVDSDPQGAHVTVNGKYLGTTPLEANLHAAGQLGAVGGTLVSIPVASTMIAIPGKGGSGQCQQSITYPSSPPSRVFFSMTNGCVSASMSLPVINNYNIQNNGAATSNIPASSDKTERKPSSAHDCAGTHSGQWKGNGDQLTLTDDCLYLYNGVDGCKSHGSYANPLGETGNLSVTIDSATPGKCLPVGKYPCTYSIESAKLSVDCGVGAFSYQRQQGSGN
ncbi:MAG: PEGA domain-containing protein [Deltaproteobacteria bacterium]|nr:PEGA domain-containing protein [Deltaproteobacteria bacterium]MBI3293095.1 PEGA domain-containing protein [Deltaproteobacteria bacterium]